MRTIVIGLMGYGTVGSGVAHLIQEHQADLAQQTGARIVLKRILVRSLDKSRPHKPSLDGVIWTQNPQDLIQDPEIDILVEVVGGVEETREWIEQALRAGKSVVTANKDLIALHGASLCALAKQQGRDLYYEASVAGGIPIIRALTESFSSDRISRLCGIVNGTTNYMLTHMTEQGSSYQDVLREAQALGYAEADPSADVLGWDAARKMTILATLAFRTEVQLTDVTTQGIANVTAKDIAYGKKLGYVVKLLGVAERIGERISVCVQPTMVQQAHPLASVNGVFNAVYVYSDAVGASMFVGPGAGSLPTAASVVADVVTAVRHVLLGMSGQTWSRSFPPRQLLADEEVKGKYFLLLSVADRIGVLAQITERFADYGVSLQTVLQQPPSQEQGHTELIMITHDTDRKSFEQCTEALTQIDAVIAVDSVYPVLHV